MGSQQHIYRSKFVQINHFGQYRQQILFITTKSKWELTSSGEASDSKPSLWALEYTIVGHFKCLGRQYALLKLGDYMLF